MIIASMGGHDLTMDATDDHAVVRFRGLEVALDATEAARLGSVLQHWARHGLLPGEGGFRATVKVYGGCPSCVAADAAWSEAL